MLPKDDLAAKQQSDYALFLPALSTFYSHYISKQQQQPPYVPASRNPFPNNSLEPLNFFNEKEAMFPYKWALYSAGHANIDVNSNDIKEDMVRKRDRDNTFMIGDSGGFQIAKGRWAADWKANSGCTRAEKYRNMVLTWLDEYFDYGMILDVPTWIINDPAAAEATNMHTYHDCVEATEYNNEYFITNRKGVSEGGCKFLNILQGANHQESKDWYDRMKKFNDPKLYPGKHFDGWAMGDSNASEIHLTLKRIIDMHFDGLLQEGKHDWIHFLGTSKLEWAVMLTAIQRNIRKYYNPSLTISFDCASPFLATTNAAIYAETKTGHNEKWRYKSIDAVDDKKYSSDTRIYKDAVIQDGLYEVFESSPVTDYVSMNDICYYAPGDLNKNGKEGRTSWDSFSYLLQMAHNVWAHIKSVQEANRAYDSGRIPAMLMRIDYDIVRFEDVVDEAFSKPTREEAYEVLEKHDKYWMQIKGMRGLTGKKSKNPNTIFNQLFVPVEQVNDTKDTEENTCTAETGFNEDKLYELEEKLDEEL